MSNGIEIIKIFETKIWIVFVDIDYFVFCIIFLSFIWNEKVLENNELY